MFAHSVHFRPEALLDLFVYEVIIRQKAIYPVLQNRSEYLAPHGLQCYRSEISRIGCFSLFVNYRIVAALFQHIGMYLCLQHSAIMMWSSERNIGHRFSMIIESWSSGQADALLLHLLTALATSLYNGGLSWHGMVGNCSFGIHDEIANLFPRFKFDSTFWK